MPTQINNSASITYVYGKNSSAKAISNVATSNILAQHSLYVEKGALCYTFRPGENITYYVKLTNNGTSPLSGLKVVEDFSDLDYLSYVNGSARFVKNNNIIGIEPSSSVPFTLELDGILSSGESVIILYEVKISSLISRDVNEVGGVLKVYSNEIDDNCQGSIEVCGSQPIILEEYAEVRVTKTVSTNSIVAGEEFNYTLILENCGNLPATGIIITDELPKGFKVSSISSFEDGEASMLEASDYSVDKNTNTLTIKSHHGGKIIVPASNGAGVGSVTIVITGKFN